jgi:hypothetical protein
VARRIDIELTSPRPDGTWTWRAAGALQPRGVLDGSLLQADAKVGDVVRADAEFEIDGITIVSVLPRRQRHRSEPQRIELLAPTVPVPGVTTQLSGRTDRRRPARDGHGQRARDTHGATPVPARGARPLRSDDRRRGVGDDGRPRVRREGEDGRPRVRREGEDGLPARESTGRRRPGGTRADATAPDRQGPGASRRANAGAVPSPRARRLNPTNTHRQAVLDSLPPEQQPIAEQVLRGGIPAVRTAIHLEREKAAAEGRPAPQAESLLALAEELLPRLKAAEWRDRAEAANKAVDEIALRDLRSVVAGADQARDDETRQLAASLRDALERRLAAGRESWMAEIGGHLDEGRVVRALRLSARSPDGGARLSAELATRLAEAAGAALDTGTPTDRWLAVLEAAAASPVRRSVRPRAVPADATPAQLAAARQHVGRVPALAAMLGITMPPPPGPARSGALSPALRRRSHAAPRVTEAGAEPVEAEAEPVEAEPVEAGAVTEPAEAVTEPAEATSEDPTATIA